MASTWRGSLPGRERVRSAAKCTRTLSGLAPDVKLVNFRVLDENGNGTDSAVIAAIDQAIELQNTSASAS